MKIPSPDAPYHERVAAAGALALSLPLLWPTFMVILAMTWVLLTGCLVIIACMVPLLPLVALQGIEPEETKTYKVKVDAEKADRIVTLLEEEGAEVEPD